jgi:hypothetical protein
MNINWLWQWRHLDPASSPCRSTILPMTDDEARRSPVAQAVAPAVLEAKAENADFPATAPDVLRPPTP